MVLSLISAQRESCCDCVNTQMSCTAREPKLPQRKCQKNKLPVSSDSSSSSSSSPDEGESAKRQERGEAERGWYLGTPLWRRLLVSQGGHPSDVSPSAAPPAHSSDAAGPGTTGQSCLSWERGVMSLQCSENMVQCQILLPV